MYLPDQVTSGQLAAVLQRKTLRVGALGPSDWGYQGRYTDAAGPPYRLALTLILALAPALTLTLG